MRLEAADPAEISIVELVSAANPVHEPAAASARPLRGPSLETIQADPVWPP
jgi:hypothetical protein